MSEIFRHYVAGLPQKSRLIIGWVCSKWRTIAFGDVSLWMSPSFKLGPSFLHQCVGGTSGPQVDNHSRQIINWLERTKGSDSLHLVLKIAHDVSEPSLLRRFIPSFQHRVRQLRLRLQKAQLDPLLNDLAPVFPHLERLLILVHGQRLDLDVWPWRKGMRTSAPSLRSLEIREGFPLLPNASTRILAPGSSGFLTSFPWAQLTSLTVEMTLRAALWRRIFCQCRSLRLASFNIVNKQNSSISESSDDETHVKAFTLPNLVSLTIRDGGGGFASVLDDVQFPVLQLFRLMKSRASRRHQVGEVVPRALAGSACTQLRFLVLLDYVSEAQLQAVLRSGPNLEKLFLTSRRLGGEDCRAVWPALDGGHLKKLQKLILAFQEREMAGESGACLKDAAEWASKATRGGWELWMTGPSRRYTTMVIKTLLGTLVIAPGNIWEDVHMLDGTHETWSDRFGGVGGCGFGIRVSIR